MRLSPSEISLVLVHNATVTFEGFVFTGGGSVLSVEPRYTLTLMAELLDLPERYRLSRRCETSTDGTVAPCCIVAKTPRDAQLSLHPLLYRRAQAAETIGAHTSAFYDEIKFFAPSLRECVGERGRQGGGQGGGQADALGGRHGGDSSTQEGWEASLALTVVELDSVLVWQPLYSNNFYHFMNNGLPRLLRLLPWLEVILTPFWPVFAHMSRPICPICDTPVFLLPWLQAHPSVKVL